MIIKDIKKAKEILDNDGIIGLPTETVYGLAGNGLNERTLSKIFAIKQRPFNNPLILHLKGKEEIDKVAMNIPDQARSLLDKFSPGPLTFLLEKKESVPDMVTAGKPTVAIRIPEHPVALELLNMLDYPLAAPSANPFGSISPTTAQHVYDYFGNELPAVLEGGACRKGLESTIVGFEKDTTIVYRLGAISIDQIEAVVGKVRLVNHNENAPEAPGMLSKHYSPETRFLLTFDLLDSIKENQSLNIGVLTMNPHFSNPLVKRVELLSGNFSLKEAASNLYAALHRLDKCELDLIIAEKFPDHGLGLAINDRLLRASK